MNRSERFYRIDQLLTARKVDTRQELLDELEISWATLKRDLAFLKDRAPIIDDRDAGGYRFAEPGAGPSYELPGLWFGADGTYALLTMHRLFSTWNRACWLRTSPPFPPGWRASSARRASASTRSPNGSTWLASATGSRMPATYLLGISEMLKMRDQGKEIYGDSDDGGSDGRADDSDAEAAPDAGADENDPESDDPVLDMGKNIFALKIILPRTIKLGQQQRATVARVPLGRFVQSMICARLFGRNVGVKALLGHPGRTRT